MAGRTLTIAGPLRGSQMQPLLSSSKRFLVSHDDFAALRPVGAVILLVSALVIAIAFLSIRFTLLAKIEDDYREIGVMKAIGFSA